MTTDIIQKVYEEILSRNKGTFLAYKIIMINYFIKNL